MMNQNSASALRPVVLIEDNELDHKAIERGLQKLEVRNPVTHFRAGEEALDYIRNYEVSAEHPEQTPALIILDLNLPDTHGREILGALKHHDELRVIPVVVWSISSDPADIKLCYLDGANSYIQKTVSLEGTQELLQHITTYWLNLVTLPPPAVPAADA